MSKFTEMLEAVRIARRNGAEFRDRSIQNMANLVRGFITYCQIPDTAVEFRPLDKEPELDKHYTVPGAMHLSNVDGYWHIGLLIALSQLHSILLELCLSEKDGRVMVKAGANDKPRALDLGDEAQCKQFYDQIVEDIKRYYTEEPLLNQDASVGRIGFQ